MIEKFRTFFSSFVEFKQVLSLSSSKKRKIFRTKENPKELHKLQAFFIFVNSLNFISSNWCLSG